MEKITLSALASDAGIATEKLGTFGDTQVIDIDYDSRRIGQGSLFFAFVGANVDGRIFAKDAVAKGAIGVVSELPAPEDFTGLWLQVPHARQVMALMARRIYARAAGDVVLTGTTGTNGKTTVCTLIDGLLRRSGLVTALLGTTGHTVAGAARPAVNTTPESVDVYRLLDEVLKAGGRHVTMEVSSHALDLGRVYGMRFHTAVFTNLTRDHLDYHKEMENYFRAKSSLFEGQAAPAPEFSVLNLDDSWAAKIEPGSGSSTIWYGLDAGAALRAVNVEATLDGLRFGVSWQGRTHDVVSPMAGRFNVHNLLAAFGAGVTLGLDPAWIADSLREPPAVPGRFQRVDLGQPFLVVVDYAHTDDALRNAISAARGVAKGRVITLFGCGGDRDRSKRPLMGQAAGELSDIVVLTSDNPRSEDPLDIMNDAMVGLGRTDCEKRAEPDRATAIRMAIAEARPGDVVLLAGKGHETTQTLRDRVIAFDDRQVAREVLKSLGFDGEPKR